MSPAERQSASAIPLLAGLDEDRVVRLLAGASIRRLAKSEVIIEEGSRSKWLHLLLGGSVEVYTMDRERSRTLLVFSASDLFMPAAALADEPHLASVRALEPSRLLFMDAAAVRAETAQCPKLACRLMTHIAGQFRAVLRHLKDDQTRSGPQRLAAYLLRLVDEKGVGGDAELPVSKGTLASRLGMTSESLSRSLQLLAEHGIVVRGHRVVLKDRAQAERFCNPDPLIDGGESDLVRAW